MTRKYMVLRGFGRKDANGNDETVLHDTVVELTDAEAKPLAKMKPPAIAVYFEDDDEDEDALEPVEQPVPLKRGRGRPRKDAAPV